MRIKFNIQQLLSQQTGATCVDYRVRKLSDLVYVWDYLWDKN